MAPSPSHADRRRIRDRARPLSFANVVSLVALCVALGGTSYAAIRLPANSVGALQIKTNAVGSSEVQNRSLRAADFRPGQLPAGRVGPKGDPGAAGAKGSAGPQGPAGNAAASAFMAKIIKPAATAPAGWFGAVTGISSGNTVSAETVTTTSPNSEFVARDLFVRASSSFPAVSDSGYRVTLWVNGAATTLECEFRGDPGRTCTSGSATATVPAGSRVTFRVAALTSEGFTPPGSDFEIGWRGITP
jgi:hypothetical protein